MYAEIGDIAIDPRHQADALKRLKASTRSLSLSYRIKAELKSNHISFYSHA
jgi:hypothetical protein